MLINYQEVKRLDFVLTLIGKPQFLIDEPTTSMDIETREHFWNLIEQLKEMV